jgi:hypothetical protein
MSDYNRALELAARARRAQQAVDAITGDVVGKTTVDMPAARGLVVGPDEILVVVMPAYSMHVMDAHRRHLREVLGDRFVMMSGDDVRLAKVKAEDWAGNAIEER